jgi:hypothetical protein
MMNELIWRPKIHTQETYEQSRKEDKPTTTPPCSDTPNAGKVEAKELLVKKIVEPTSFYDNNGVFRMSSMKREEVNLKMHEREPISQRNQNPYLVQNNYIEDLDTQQSFLMPKNSNYSKKLAPAESV